MVIEHYITQTITFLYQVITHQNLWDLTHQIVKPIVKASKNIDRLVHIVQSAITGEKYQGDYFSE